MIMFPYFVLTSISRRLSQKRDEPAGFRSFNGSPRGLVSNYSTLEPSLPDRHRDLVRQDEDLRGITDKNEWDEIWKYAKIKEQEEQAIAKHKKLAQKLQFNSDLRQQIMENRQKKLAETRLKAKDLEDACRRDPSEDTKKLLKKAKQIDLRVYNDSAQIQKDTSERELFRQRRLYEQSLLEQTQKALEAEKAKSYLAKLTKQQENKKRIEETELARKQRLKLKRDEKLQDLKYSEQFIEMLDRQEQLKAARLDEIKRKVDNQPAVLPSRREMNIYGLSVQEEDRQMFTRMKNDEARDKAQVFATRVEKLEQQKALREYLDKQIMEKQGRKDIEKFKNDYFYQQISKDKSDFDSSETSKKHEKKLMEKRNFDSITEQINAKKSKSPAEVIDKFGIGGMNKEEFLMNKSILLDISRKKMELLGDAPSSQPPV